MNRGTERERTTTSARHEDGARHVEHARRTERAVLSLAPMMELTDRHFRFLLRQITRRTLLYSEMVTATAVVHGDQERLLGRHPGEGRVALQLGGDDPELLARAARAGVEFGYAEINLNVGCPSDRVKSGNFGACLMADPERVAACVQAMREAVAVPVTVKHRIGIDHQDSYEEMRNFVEVVAGDVDAPASDAFTVHARKAWLQGLSPKENRTVPPLRYEEVYRLKRELPSLTVELNGGVTSLDEAEAHLRHVDGVMIGRALYEDPYRFAGADALVARTLGEPAAPEPPGRREVVDAMLPYLEERLAAGTPLQAMTRHMLGLFRGQPGGKAWRRVISENAYKPGAGPEVVEAALAALPAEAFGREPAGMQRAPKQEARTAA